MKTNFFLLTFLSGILYLSGCDDTIDSIGSGIQPDGDKIEIYDLSLNISGKTVKLDSVFIKSIGIQLGNISHPIYGSLKGEYACQFYPSAKFELDSMLKNDIDSIKLQIMYDQFHGNSLTPMEVSIYPLQEQLEKDYYTNIDLSKYADMQTLLGKRSYTARDLNISDSIYYENENSTSRSYKVLSVTLPKELGQKFFEEYKKGKEGAFASPEAFTQFFPGAYITPSFGNGCLLDVEKTSIFIYYQRKWQTLTSEGNDTIIEGTTYESLNVTKEIIQINNYINYNDDELLVPNADKMYLKSPAGLYSKLTIPLAQIIDSIGNRKFSSVELSVSAYPQDDWEFPWEFPGTYKEVAGLETAKSKLLLLEPDSLVTFFEKQQAADNLTSYYATYNSSTDSYVFRNISNVLQNAIDKTEGKNYKDLELLLIPVTVPYYYASSDYYKTNPLDYATYHYLYPAAVTLKKGGDNLKLNIIAADLEVNQN